LIGHHTHSLGLYLFVIVHDSASFDGLLDHSYLRNTSCFFYPLCFLLLPGLVPGANFGFLNVLFFHYDFLDHAGNRFHYYLAFLDSFGFVTNFWNSFLHRSDDSFLDGALDWPVLNLL